VAVARGLLRRGQVDTCRQYQEAMAKIPGQDPKRLGEIFVAKRLLTKAQLDSLLDEQRDRSIEEVAAAAERAYRAARPSHPVAEDQREAIRRSVAAAARKHRKKKPPRGIHLPGPISRLWGAHYVLIVTVVLGALIVVKLWPASAAERTLVAYLKSCGEDAAQPDRTLAFRDLNLTVRDFRDVRLLPAVRYDYTTELNAFRHQDEGEGWVDFLDFLESMDSPAQKREALSLVAASFPDELEPRAVPSLTITVQPATLHLHFKPRGTAMFREGRFRFLLLKVRSPAWRRGWKVGSYERIGAAGSG